jgi:hypothetical protein
MRSTRTDATSVALRYGTGAVLGGLVLFHVWLAGRRLADPTGLDPHVLFRWLAGFGVVGALLWLRRLGLPLLRGKKALALWTVALLLHGNSGTARLAAEAEATTAPEALVLVLPGVLSLVTASALLLVAALRPRPLLAPASPSGLARSFSSGRLLAPGRTGRGCRAPPAVS